MNNDEFKNDNGSITVFLSIILLLIISLILTTLEGARVSVAKTFVTRSFTQGLDSILAQYHAPLLKDYHIFALDGSYGTGELDTEHMEREFNKYFSFSLSNDNEEVFDKSIDFLDILIDEIELTNVTSLLDYNGVLFENQILEHMKYGVIDDLLSEKASTEEALEKTQAVSELSEVKEEVEEELVEIDKSILKLMTLLDGVGTSQIGIKLSIRNKLSIKDNFIKNICSKNVTMHNTGINNNIVFSALQNKYNNPLVFTNELNFILDNLIEISSNKESDDENIESIEDNVLNITSNFKGNYNYYIHKLENLISGKLNLITKAIDTIDGIDNKKRLARPLVYDYEEKLVDKKTSIGDEVYKGYEEDLQDMKAYVNTDNHMLDFNKMKNILLNNRQVIEDLEGYLMKMNLDYGDSYIKVKENIYRFEERIKQYNIKDLQLDYSSLTLKDKSLGNPISKVKEVIDNGIISLVIDAETISSKGISNKDLPSDAISQNTLKIINLFQNISEDYVTGASKDIFANYNNSEVNIIINEVENLINKVMFLSYINTNFMNFNDTLDKEDDDLSTALSYEQEYILNRNYNDRENLIATVNKILLIRIMMNFISVLGNKKLIKEAEVIAYGLVGFTAMPMLVKGVQTVLLLIISFIESLIEIAALHQGKSIELIKHSEMILANFKDIFLLNRENILKKSEKIKGEPGIGKVSYATYLNVLLLASSKEKLRFYSMDLIQKNINLRYDEKFLIKNCIFDISFKVKGKIGSKFFDFTKLGNLENSQFYEFIEEGIYSY